MKKLEMSLSLPVTLIEKSFGYNLIKRIIDITGSLFLLTFTWPLFIIIPLLIKIDSSGPVFFLQKRLGLKGKIFHAIKFRSMVAKAEDMLKSEKELMEEYLKCYKIAEDPRVTKIGYYLRKSSLDEIPQIFNILKGDMSLVGPRPIVIVELEKYGRHKDEFLSVKPGLTGLWQVSGRNELTYEERVALDIKYIIERSVWTDIMILFKTFYAVISARGAC
jgi:lipopolysaccharide/colanic/teichoic acid biosynthesis glycosyltransferase